MTYRPPDSGCTVLQVLCGNLLCRLPDPMALLKRLPSLVHVGGVVVLVSPYSWLEESALAPFSPGCRYRCKYAPPGPRHAPQHINVQVHFLPLTSR